MTVSPLTLPEIERGPLQMRPPLVSATWHGAPVALTRVPYLLVHVLADQPGWIHSRSDLLDALHGADYLCYGDRSIDSLVKIVRRAFRSTDPSFRALEAVYGVGYRWVQTPR